LFYTVVREIPPGDVKKRLTVFLEADVSFDDDEW